MPRFAFAFVVSDFDSKHVGFKPVDHALGERGAVKRGEAQGSFEEYCGGHGDVCGFISLGDPGAAVGGDYPFPNVGLDYAFGVAFAESNVFAGGFVPGFVGQVYLLCEAGYVGVGA